VVGVDQIRDKYIGKPYYHKCAGSPTHWRIASSWHVVGCLQLIILQVVNYFTAYNPDHMIIVVKVIDTIKHIDVENPR